MERGPAPTQKKGTPSGKGFWTSHPPGDFALRALIESLSFHRVLCCPGPPLDHLMLPLITWGLTCHLALALIIWGLACHLMFPLITWGLTCHQVFPLTIWGLTCHLMFHRQPGKHKLAKKGGRGNLTFLKSSSKKFKLGPTALKKFHS